MSWNVNGIRAVHRKDALTPVLKKNFDVICFQETKLSHANQLPDELLSPYDYLSYWHCATERKGYSGTAIYAKEEPLLLKNDFGKSLLSEEGRVQEIHFEHFVLLNIYFPNGGRSKDRLNYKMKFYAEFLTYIKKLEKKHPHIIFCGDVNTAHKEIDLAHPKENENSSGFLAMERAWIDDVITAGYTDTFRLFSEKPDEYTWWDMKTRARDRNIGWRIDYFFVSKALKKHITKSEIFQNIIGSDHCPVTLEFKI